MNSSSIPSGSGKWKINIEGSKENLSLSDLLAEYEIELLENGGKLKGTAFFKKQAEGTVDYKGKIAGNLVDEKNAKFTIHGYTLDEIDAGCSIIEIEMKKGFESFEGTWNNLADNRYGKYRGIRIK